FAVLMKPFLLVGLPAFALTLVAGSCQGPDEYLRGGSPGAAGDGNIVGVGGSGLSGQAGASPVGTAGASGTSGVAGRGGTTGTAGTTGAAGRGGTTGTAGATGTAGTTGAAGRSGANCVDNIRVMGYAYSPAQPCSVCKDNQTDLSAKCMMMID